MGRPCDLLLELLLRVGAAAALLLMTLRAAVQKVLTDVANGIGESLGQALAEMGTVLLLAAGGAGAGRPGGAGGPG
jgi:hypothetical protein